MIGVESLEAIKALDLNEARGKDAKGFEQRHTTSLAVGGIASGKARQDRARQCKVR